MGIVILKAVIVGICLGLFVFLVDDDGPLGVAMGLVACFFVGIVGFAILTVIESDRDHEYKRELCTSKGGVVSEGMCFRDNRPIEFEPGVWK